MHIHKTLLPLFVLLFAAVGSRAEIGPGPQAGAPIEATVVFSKKNPGRYLRLFMASPTHVKIESCTVAATVACRALGRSAGYTENELVHYSAISRWQAMETAAFKSLLYGAPLVTLAPAAVGTGLKFFVTGLVVRQVGRVIVASPLAKASGLFAGYVSGATVLVADKAMPVYLSLINFAVYYFTNLPGEWKKAWQSQKQAVSLPWNAGTFLSSRSTAALEFNGDLEQLEQELERLFKSEPPKPGMPRFGDFGQAKAG